MGSETCSRRQRHALAFSKGAQAARPHAPRPNQDGTRSYCVFECIVTVKTLGNRGTVCPEPLRSAAGTPPLH